MTSRTVTLAIEGSADVDVVTIDRHDNTISVRLPRFVDAECVNWAAAHFIEQELDIQPDRLKVVHVRFRDRDAALSLAAFLSQFAASVVQLSLKDIHTSEDNNNNNNNKIDAESLEILLSSLLLKTTSPVEVLNLSQNTLQPSIWRYVGHCQCIRKLLLDHVSMDTRSMKEFTTYVPVNTLEDLYLVFVRSPGEESAMEACDFVAKCTQLLSFRWAAGTLPWAGLKMTQSLNLRHLILDGSMIRVSELGDDGLCGALRQLGQLRTLKLRDVGLRDNGVKAVVAALKSARPPLEWLELNGNQIEDASCIADLALVEKIISVLDVVSLERNPISSESARVLLEAFGPMVEVDLRLDSHRIDFQQIALDLLRRDSSDVDTKQKAHHEKTIQTLTAENATMNEEIRKLQNECKTLRMERNTLIQAFSIMGVSRQVEEHQRIVESIARIEERFGLSRHGSERSGSFRIPPRSRSLYEPSTPQSESASLGLPNSRGSVLSSAGSDGSRRRMMITRDDHSQATSSRSGINSSMRQLSPAPIFLSPGTSSTATMKENVGRVLPSDRQQNVIRLADPSDTHASPSGNPVFVRRRSLMGNDIETPPEVQTPSAQRRVLTRTPNMRMQNSMDLEKHGSSYQTSPGNREPVRAVRRYASDRSRTSDTDGTSPSGSSSRVPRAVMLGNDFNDTESMSYQESFHH
ncbi:hypothetical protein FisN_19Lh068 [Fistulifera solaris]|uniref:Uncharacterized protein n=1 Tax=Fistulifera solaris TaxID=1519565 RepID=A0A1Z5JRU9_FISSO|nr:hypothetical protein FisN_19Lh068 [Fistulifera solaris]|eukprot:GAX16488.1 hypothetical protein FisN_19Lh068 [Fistulifera solaris]